MSSTFVPAAPQLPYQTQPQGDSCLVGDTVCGTLSIPRYGSLTPNELIYFKELTARLPDMKGAVVKTCTKISKEVGCSFMAVYNEITTGNLNIVGDYLEDIFHLDGIEPIAKQGHVLAMAATIIKFRIAPEWTLSNTEDPKQIHPLLVQKIAEFGDNEMQGWKKSEEVTEESLKKNLMTKQTGQKSSGESKPTGNPTSDSLMSTLEINPSG